MRSLYCIVYDIRNAARLRKVTKIAENYGLRRQKSVFEAELSVSELAQMKRQMLAVIAPEEDGIKIFHLCEACEARRTGTGSGRPELPDRAWHIF